MVFDEGLGKQFPKLAFHESMKSRTVSVYSAGKILAATGIRVGWVIGPSSLIKSIYSIHQYNVFCYYNVIEEAVADCMEKIAEKDNTYSYDYALKLQNLRD